MKHLANFSFCPACASGRIAIHQKNAVKCDACGYVYFHNCAASVAAIVEIDTSILLLRRKHEPRSNSLVFPGGFVDYNETLEAALEREVGEECGVELCDLRYFGSFPNTYRYLDVTYYTADAFFIGKATDVSTLRLSDENSEIVLVNPQTVDEQTIAFDSMRRALAAYRELLDRNSR